MDFLRLICKHFMAEKPASFFAILELAEAERQVLISQTALEYAEASVMFNKKRVERLAEYLGVGRCGA